jgi:hypothetical protein
MKRFLNILGGVCIIVVLMFVHFGTLYLLPYPWSTINTTMIFTTLMIIGWENGYIVWLIMIFYYLIELYSGSYFGMILFSATISTLFSFWIYEIYFEKRTWFAGFGLSMIMLLIFRVIYSSLFLIITFVDDGVIPWRSFFMPYLSEIIITPIVAGGIIFILSKTTSTFEPVRELHY